jgi:isopenicillin-N N-acyltransferase like protein
MSRPLLVELDEPDPWRRGRERGWLTAPRIEHAWAGYSRLFDAAAQARGTPLDVQALAAGALSATGAWAPELVREMEGVAEGAGLPVWVIAALNARTEILAAAGVVKPGECSAVVSTRGATVGGQSWDWHEELAGDWHVQSVAGDRFPFVGLTEHGMLAKVGLNAAGVGVLFNILGHERDDAGGVPVHLVARRVLGAAGSFAEAVEILRTAPVSASTVMTVVTADESACIEVSPAGAAVVPGRDGWLVHTNHFLDPVLATGERRGRQEPETFDRQRVLADRARRVGSVDDRYDVAALLDVHPDGGAEVCCHPPVAATLGARWATLATVAVEPAAHRLWVHPGGPCGVSTDGWVRLTAG